MQLQARPPVSRLGCSTARGALPLSAGAARRLGQPGPDCGSPPRNGSRARERGRARRRRAAQPAANGVRAAEAPGRALPGPLRPAPDRHAQSLGSPSGFRADQAHGAHRARAAPGGAVMGLGLGSEPILAEGRARLAWVVPPGIAVLGDGHELHGGEARAGHVRQPARCRLKRALRREAAHVHLPPVARAASGGPPPSRTAGPCSWDRISQPGPAPPAAQGEHGAKAGTSLGRRRWLTRSALHNGKRGQLFLRGAGRWQAGAS